MIKNRSSTDPHGYRIAETAPSGDLVTRADKELHPVYIEILDRVAARQNWCDIARDLLQIDADQFPQHARARYESYYDRARWMRDKGYKQLTDARTPEEAFIAWATAILQKMIEAGDVTYQGSDDPGGMGKSADRTADDGGTS